MSTVPQVNNEAEYQTITSSSNFSVIYFYSTQCGYCDLMTPVVEETANCYATGMLKFYRVNGQDSWPGVQRLTTRLKINSYPQVWVFRDNKVCARQPGYIIYPRFEEWLSFHTSCNKNGFAVRACTVNTVDSGDEANENSPLRIRGNSTELNEADTSYKKELFAIWAIRSAPYFGPLLAFLKRIAIAKADDADFLLLIMDQEDVSQPP
ncbi:hypothetical protein GALMADRAFT_507427 [Galerina marginata CBS 339.88]|uniref:Thioredoxin domain-containing protein n=1 Tax=Galerina marginata (strain CBS 339.88) TaxID=685588 RepID=A0A067SY48_GALM3|nr:hypothetical protein GALMADRAFT_507427 [Galerina marginata CBS 339.88]